MRKIPDAIIVIMLISLSSCATIMSRSSYEVRVNSNPKDATVTIFNRKGHEVYSGNTPFQVRLQPHAGYFKKAVYSIEFTKNGYSDKNIILSSDINEWYFGNLLIGGFIGMLIIDPATGAMYKLKNTDINVTMSPLNASTKNEISYYGSNGK